jgi:hypothetical protein
VRVSKIKQLRVSNSAPGIARATNISINYFARCSFRHITIIVNIIDSARKPEDCDFAVTLHH